MASLAASVDSKTSSKRRQRVVLIALGINSADELQPLICLARSLTLGTKGFSPEAISVAIVTHPHYADLLAESGVAFLDGGPCPFQARSTIAEGRALDSKVPRADGEAVGDRLSAFMKVLTSEWFAKGQTALSDFQADAAILCSTGAVFVYPSICEVSGIVQFAVLDNSPMSKTAEFGPPRGFGNSQAGFRWVNESRWDLHAKSMWSFLYRSGVNAAREKYGLPPDERELGPWEEVNKGGPLPILLAYSEVLLARPLEWGQGVTILGPLIDADRTQPLSPPLLEFSEAAATNGSSLSSCLVYVAFGEQFNSVSTRESRLRILTTCLSAVAAIDGARAVVVCPPECGVSIDTLRQQLSPQRCLVLPKRPSPGQEATLWAQRNVAVLCSGDPWTVHAAVLAGAPLVSLDFGRDDTPEAFWGSRAFLAGVAAEPVPVKRPTGVAAGSGAPQQAAEAQAVSLLSSLETSLRAVVAPGSPFRAAAKAASQAMRQKQAQTLPGACTALSALVTALTSGERRQPIPKLPLVGNGAVAVPAHKPVDAASSLSSQKNGGAAAAVAAPAAQVVADGKRPAGFSFSHRAALTNGGPSDATNVWRRGDDHLFKVRTGPNYRKNGRKAASQSSLFELVHVDMFKSQKKMEGHSRWLRYPPVPRDTHHASVPALLVVNGSLPLEAPSMLSPATDGPTLNALFYFAIKQSTCDALANLATAPNGVKLLHKWCSHAPAHPETFARFKCIGLVRNYEEAGMPSMFKSFNGKPVLIRNREVTKGGSGFLERGKAGETSFLELNVNIRTWPYLAKQGLGYLMSGLDKTDLDVGFVIEGSSDEELPEVLLGSARLTKLKLDQVISWPEKQAPPSNGNGSGSKSWGRRGSS
eukprot:CAMPEP_0171688532 /NCGR_PEP_ID=MMETSP0991-20121206/3945_1 /TAXON_ID=483369 /ORGANISM="non described non described, Strain CCMP2098" /LENGTH=869 /DNA_ID=CAMNT_0012276479 /DNA_START=34 /DNA_END=2643 /DNA_ORIENTATION=+